DLNIPCANYVIVHSVEELRSAVDQIGLPSILKTTTDGYDGKGQFFIRNESEIQKAWGSLSTSEAILEGFVNFNRELSIIGVRGLSGEQVFYPLVENIHKDGILRITIAPAKKISNEIQRLAEEYITKIFDSTNHIGALTVELFETNDGLLVNEIAPRVHNSGHWTINGCTTSQFENHIRAISGMPLGSINVKSNWCAMINIIGKVGNIQQFADKKNLFVNLYGKAERENRKIGHINVVAESEKDLKKLLELLSDYYPLDCWKN
ncbi:MAG: ATP-grasp domain-containing protein, partial [Gammaproteobacteria bacterium]